MSATFKVHKAFALPSRSLFVLAGEILQGTVQRGMKVHVSLNEAMSMVLPVEAVEFLRTGGAEHVALTVALEDSSDADFLQQFDLVGESLDVSAEA